MLTTKTSGAPTINTSLVQQLVATQFPKLANLPITEVKPNGWDNRTFRLGDKMSVRLPSAERYAPQVLKEQRWLPKLAPHLPLPIPTPLELGQPTPNYPHQWSINRWIDGEPASTGHITSLPKLATTLAQFHLALREIPTENGPTPGPHNFHRGGNLSVYNDQTREAISILKNELDNALLTDVWDQALDSTWQHPPVWVHGDISPGNLIVKNGQLAAVIDFGGMCIGDPACDLAITWTMFNTESRKTFHTALQLDNETWARARGWTLWKALIIRAGISTTNATEAQHSQKIITQILTDHTTPSS